MKKLVISSLMVLVLLLGVSMYLGQVGEANASGVLSMEEMGKVSGAGFTCQRCIPNGGSCGNANFCINTVIGSICTNQNGETYSKCGTRLLCNDTCGNNVAVSCGTQTTKTKQGEEIVTPITASGC